MYQDVIVQGGQDWGDRERRRGKNIVYTLAPTKLISIYYYLKGYEYAMTILLT